MQSVDRTYNKHTDAYISFYIYIIYYITPSEVPRATTQPAKPMQEQAPAAETWACQLVILPTEKHDFQDLS